MKTTTRTAKIKSVISDGVLYLEASNCGIPSMFQLIDGLDHYTFGKSRKSYMKVDDLIAWHKKELAFNHTDLRVKAIEKLEQMKEEFTYGTNF